LRERGTYDAMIDLIPFRELQRLVAPTP